MISLIQTTSPVPGDKEFMTDLYFKYKKLMYSTVHKYVSDFQMMDDIIQDCLVRLFEKIDTLRPMPEKVLAGYIVSTVRNTAINKLKVEEYEKKHAADYAEEQLSGTGKSVPLETLFLLSERRRSLLRVWPMLSRENQILLEGKYILGYTDQELAGQLRCKPGSIRMKLTRARRAAFSTRSSCRGSIWITTSISRADPVHTDKGELPEVFAMPEVPLLYRNPSAHVNSLPAVCASSGSFGATEKSPSRRELR